MQGCEESVALELICVCWALLLTSALMLQVERFIQPDGGETAPVLQLHALSPGTPYHLAFFLTGVYQVRVSMKATV